MSHIRADEVTSDPDHPYAPLWSDVATARMALRLNGYDARILLAHLAFDSTATTRLAEHADRDLADFWSMYDGPAGEEVRPGPIIIGRHVGGHLSWRVMGDPRVYGRHIEEEFTRLPSEEPTSTPDGSAT